MRSYSKIILALAVVACGGERQAAAPDSALARELALAGRDAPSGTFIPADTAFGPAPARSVEAPTRRPSPVPRTGAPVVARPATSTPAPVARPEPEEPSAQPPLSSPESQAPAIAAGTALALATGTRVCTSNRVGDKLVATVRESVTGPGGAMIPAGSQVVLEVASVTHGQTADATQLALRVRAISLAGQSHPARGTVEPLDTLATMKAEEQNRNTKGKVIGGAIAGAVLGQVIGKDTKGTLIGAAAGAATGAAAAQASTRYERCLPAGAALRLTLTDKLVLAGA